MSTLNTRHRALISKTHQGLAASLMLLGIITFAPSAHAEQFCKSVDTTGATSYVLAPPTGCNKKKYTPVQVSHHITPQPAAPVAAAPATANAPAATATSSTSTTTSNAPTSTNTQAAAPTATNTQAAAPTVPATTPGVPTLNNQPISSLKANTNKQ